ncbi:PH domain-containing protein [Paenibacillus urinalis]|uniref:PH domain-containing protein n=1 Tax=Paenibacillus urinalis TaxID=521520 RepID=A0AAX3N2D2_9BACL|nr:PH domain-containing protein [Paenibacillus urinalis]WDH83521.1 PH domain-containing protein [Paenibacillus urinalis]
MLGISVRRSGDQLVIRWQFTRVEIPMDTIVSVTHDDTYAGEIKNAIRIGTPQGTTDRIVIHTQDKAYILFTTNVSSILNSINKYRDEYLKASS